MQKKIKAELKEKKKKRIKYLRNNKRCAELRKKPYEQYDSVQGKCIYDLDHMAMLTRCDKEELERLELGLD